MCQNKGAKRQETTRDQSPHLPEPFRQVSCCKVGERTSQVKSNPGKIALTLNSNTGTRMRMLLARSLSTAPTTHLNKYSATRAAPKTSSPPEQPPRALSQHCKHTCRMLGEPLACVHAALHACSTVSAQHCAPACQMFKHCTNTCRIIRTPHRPNDLLKCAHLPLRTRLPNDKRTCSSPSVQHRPHARNIFHLLQLWFKHPMSYLDPLPDVSFLRSFVHSTVRLHTLLH